MLSVVVCCTNYYETLFSPINICLGYLLLNGCNNSSFQQNIEKEVPVRQKEISDNTLMEVEFLIKESQDYQENIDFDGDKMKGCISFEYTGGAHGCYKMVLELSTIEDTLNYPFEMDGGTDLVLLMEVR